jgi:hypothetical protein
MPRVWRKALRWGRNGRRQQRQRIERDFDCTWLSPWGEEKSRLKSLSPSGCYIASRFTTPSEGTVVQHLTITLPTGSVTLQGTVIDPMRGIGFAVRFTDLDKDTRDWLSVLVQDLQTTVDDRSGGDSTSARQ